MPKYCAPSISRRAERTIQALEDMLRACVLKFTGGLDKHLPLIKFPYNNSCHSTIKMAPYKALYGKKCISPSCWLQAGEKVFIGSGLIHKTTENVEIIRKRMMATQNDERATQTLRID